MKFIYESDVWRTLIELIEMERQAYTGDEDLPAEQVTELEENGVVPAYEDYYRRTPITPELSAAQWAARLIQEFLTFAGDLDEEDVELLEDPIAEMLWEVIRDFEAFALTIIAPNFAKHLRLNSVESLGGFDLCFEVDPVILDVI